MDTQLKANPYIVEHLLYPGLYILAGAPKIGKSWLALDLCLSVAEGEPFLKHETHRGQVLYLALEDSLLRLQNRLYEFTDEPSEGLQFSTLASTIGNGLEQQLEDAKKKLSNTENTVSQDRGALVSTLNDNTRVRVDTPWGVGRITSENNGAVRNKLMKEADTLSVKRDNQAQDVIDLQLKLEAAQKTLDTMLQGK